MNHFRLHRSLAFFALLAFFSMAQAQESAIVYPQLAIGGGFEVVLAVSNPGDEAWNGEAVAPQFGPDSGVAWMVNGEDRTGSDRFPVSLPPRATRRFVLSAPEGASAVSGSLEIRPLEGAAADSLATSFFYDFSVAGELVDSVGSPPARAAFHAVIPVELDPAARVNTGIAIRRPSPDGSAATGADGGGPVLKASLYDADGTLLAVVFESESAARFFDQVFDSAVAPDEPFLGSIEVASEEAFHLTALRQRLLEGGRFQLTGVPALIPPGDVPAPSFAARYRVTFQATWSAATHPDEFPPGPHFSGLVGGVHDASTRFWAPGQTASAGIERMAELGSQGPLSLEVQQAIAEGAARGVLIGGGIGPSPGQTALEFDVDQRHPLVTLVSMIAPSPDWFVGVNGLNLYRNGRWVEDLTMKLYPFDAGTDSGSTYAAADSDTQPREPIREITGPPFRNGGVVQPMGSFRFERID